MTDYEVERALGCTPCVCGDLETWHFACYAGKSHADLLAGYKAAMRKARTHLKRQADAMLLAALKGAPQ